MAANTTSPDGTETRAANETLKRGVLLAVVANWVNILLFMVGWWLNVLYHRLNPKIFGDPYWNVPLSDIVGTMILFLGFSLVAVVGIAILEGVTIAGILRWLSRRQRLHTIAGVLVGGVAGLLMAVAVAVALLVVAVMVFYSEGNVASPSGPWLLQPLIGSVLAGVWLGWRMTRWLQERVEPRLS